MERYEVKTSDLHLAFDPEQPGLTTVYLADEADARIAEMRQAFETSSTDEERKLRARIAELEREVAAITAQRDRVWSQLLDAREQIQRLTFGRSTN